MRLRKCGDVEKVFLGQFSSALKIRHVITMPRCNEESYLEGEAVVIRVNVSSFPIMIMIEADRDVRRWALECPCI